MMILVFETGPTIKGKVVQVFTWSKYSHVDVLTEQNTTLSAYPDGGVDERPYVPLASNVLCKIETTPEQLAQIHKYMRDRIGKPYDWGGVFGVFFKQTRWQDHDKWFCSELIAAALQSAGIQLFKKPDFRVVPKHLARHPRVIPLT